MNRPISSLQISSDSQGRGKYKSSVLIKCPEGLELLKMREYLTKFGEVVELRVMSWKDLNTKKVCETFCRFLTEECVVEFLNASHRVEGKEVDL